MPLINFALRPVDEIEPWGTTPDLSLSWFGLTDGIYWIDAGGEQLFRYSDKLVESWPNDSFVGPYVDYQVSRLYEDLIAILPAILCPLPHRLSVLIQKSMESPSWLDAYFSWEGQISKDDDRLWDLGYSASGWLCERSLTTLHLLACPRIKIWRESDWITIAWNNSDLEIRGIKAWKSLRGSYRLKIDEFVSEISSFHDRLMSEMSRRVDSIRAGWDRPEIRIDMDWLLKEQAYREGILESALNQQPNSIDELAIVDAINHILGSTPPKSE